MENKRDIGSIFAWIGFSLVIVLGIMPAILLTVDTSTGGKIIEGIDKDTNKPYKGETFGAISDAWKGGDTNWTPFILGLTTIIGVGTNISLIAAVVKFKLRSKEDAKQSNKMVSTLSRMKGAL